MDFYRADEWTPKAVEWSEPPLTTAEKYKNQNAVALIPGVGFSISGHRLGFGKGHYDRYLKKHPQIFRVGIAYAFQIQLQDWTIEDHDEPMHLILTPSGVWSVGRR